jgi:flagellar hook-associated protein 3 FlgL
MRVSSSMFPNLLTQELGVLSQQLQKLQTASATGQKIREPEDDPSAVQQVLNMQTESGALQQYQSNISTLQATATAAGSAVSGLQQIVTRLSDIATSAGAGTISQQDLDSYATEVNQLLNEAVSTANTQYNGEYLFGGTINNKPPFVATTDSNGQITSVAYEGNTSTASAEIAQGVTVSVVSPGANTSGSGAGGLITDSRTGADLFAHMISLRNDLTSGNVTAVTSTDLPSLQADEQNQILYSTNINVTEGRLSTATTAAQNQQTSLTTLISNDADADLAQTITSLSQAQYAYQAALQSGATILKQSLLDYLQ